MPHVLCKLHNVDFAAIKNMLQEHESVHAKEGLHLENVWRNMDVEREVLFLFRADNLEYARSFILNTHAKARKQDPNANLPDVTFLDE
jgi:hypothetical protein